jgi:hypothetical protein
MTAYFDVPQHYHPTAAGDIGLPILYYNSAAVFASFLVDSARAQALLPADLAAVSVAPGKAVATVAFFQYVDSSVGPYNEMGLAISARPAPAHGFRDTAPLHPRRSLLPGMFVVDLPVTTATALAAGRELWGYPKIVTPIDFRLRGGALDCAVHDDAGALLCALRGRSGRGLPLGAPNLLTYTCLDGKLLRTTIDLRGRMRHARAGTVRLDAGAGDHPLSRHLQALGLQGAAPVLLQYGQGLRALLPAGEVVR